MLIGWFLDCGKLTWKGGWWRGRALLSMENPLSFQPPFLKLPVRGVAAGPNKRVTINQALPFMNQNLRGGTDHAH